MLFKTSLIASIAALAAAQAPANESLCDYYTTALTKNNTAANQLTVLTLLVNTAVIGNYSPLANASVKVPGILNPAGSYMGTPVNLVPYFSGQFASTNNNGTAGVQKNFLDGGGAAPLTQNKPANDTSSNQYFLLTHLYEFFGLLLGCSQVGMTGYPAYGGKTNMYEVHKFMVLNPAQNGYFIEQVALSAQSFGVAPSDIAKVGTALNTLFNYRCSAPTAIVPGAANQSQSICTASACPVAPGGNCANFANYTSPAGNSTTGTATSGGASGSSGSATGSAGSATGTTRAGADVVKVGASLTAAIFGLLVYVTLM